MDFPFPKTEKLLRDAVRNKECSGLACYARFGREEATLYLGETAHAESGAKVAAVGRDTLFDLASLTKILSTVFLISYAIKEKKLHLEDPIQKYFPTYPHAQVSLRSLLEHRAGFVWHEKFYERFTAENIPLDKNKFLEEWILGTAVAAADKVETTYSDLDFLLLGCLLTNIYQKSLYDLFLEKIFQLTHPKLFGFRLLHSGSANLGVQAPQDHFSATEFCSWRKKILQGEVHDDNAWALGGVAGHAGLFGNLMDTKKCFLQLIQQLQGLSDFLLESEIAEKGKKALEKPFIPQFYKGFMIYPGLRAFEGREWQGAIGHTGFTGTSAWFHPPTQSLVILLANRIHPSREDNRWIATRLEVQKTLWREGIA